MGQFWSQYDPFSVYGQYNLKDTLYENKKTATSVIIALIIISIAAIVVIWTSGGNDSIKTKVKYDIPAAKAGYGPYGYGSYLPPKEMLAKAIATS
jgi:hypothetical protein